MRVCMCVEEDGTDSLSALGFTHEKGDKICGEGEAKEREWTEGGIKERKRCRGDKIDGWRNSVVCFWAGQGRRRWVGTRERYKCCYEKRQPLVRCSLMAVLV